MNKSHGRKDGRVVGMGEIEGHDIEVMAFQFSFGERYTWRALKDGKIVHESHDYVDGIAEAIDGAILHFYPDAVPVEAVEPDKRDWDILNAVLYTGGQNDDIENFADLVASRDNLVGAVATLRLGNQKAADDFEYAVNALAKILGPQHQAVINMTAIKDLFYDQCNVILEITERSVAAHEAFLGQFLK